MKDSYIFHGCTLKRVNAEQFRLKAGLHEEVVSERTARAIIKANGGNWE